jgi:hypothetical protein
MKTNTPAKGAKAKKARGKANPLAEFEGNEYNGTREEIAWQLSKNTWSEFRRGEKSWDVLFETNASKPFEGAKDMPVGSEYHSYILAHQKLVKTRKNTYAMKLEGLKFKLAHKEDGASWSSNERGRKNQLIKILKEMLATLESGHGRAPSDQKKFSKPKRKSDNS